MADAPRPVRLRLSRRRGFDLQALSLATNGLPAVNVARPSRWGNPYKVGDYHPYALPENLATPEGRAEMRMNAECVVTLFEVCARAPGDDWPAPLAELRGKNLACWCAPGEPCHADVLLEIANA